MSQRAPLFVPLSLVLFYSLVTLGCPSKRAEPPSVEPAPAPEVVAAAPLPSGCDPNSPCPGSTCLASITTAAATVPADACPRFGEFQSDVDVFAWNSFIALNWPADLSTCTADTNNSILSGTGPTVWESYTLASDIFVESGAPAAWCAPEATALLAGARPFGRTSKVSEELGEALPDIDEAVGGVLTDQNGRFVRYEVRVNQDEYNYLTINNLWNKAGQAGQTINFPQGPNDDPSRCGALPCGPVGAMEVKAAWKVLAESEIAGGRFYTTSGTVFNDEKGSPSPGANPVTLGLVGLHIIHKTESQSNWFWSTFEHVDNTTSSFFDPSCTTCPANQQTASEPYTELDPQGKPLNQGVQVERVNPIATTDSAAPPLSTYYQGLLAGTVWANYELISTQWTTGGAPQGTPAVLANTTLETFIQADSSCFGCHSGAKTAVGTPADLSFLLGGAH